MTLTIIAESICQEIGSLIRKIQSRIAEYEESTVKRHTFFSNTNNQLNKPAECQTQLSNYYQATNNEKCMIDEALFSIYKRTEKLNLICSNRDDIVKRLNQIPGFSELKIQLKKIKERMSPEIISDTETACDEITYAARLKKH